MALWKWFLQTITKAPQQHAGVVKYVPPPPVNTSRGQKLLKHWKFHVFVYFFVENVAKTLEISCISCFFNQNTGFLIKIQEKLLEISCISDLHNDKIPDPNNPNDQKREGVHRRSVHQDKISATKAQTTRAPRGVGKHIYLHHPDAVAFS